MAVNVYSDSIPIKEKELKTSKGGWIDKLKARPTANFRF